MSKESHFEQVEIFEENDIVQLQLMANAWMALEENSKIQITDRQYVVTAYSTNSALAGAASKSYSLAIFYYKK